MEKLLTDEWDGEYVVVRREPVSGAVLVVAIDSTRRGPAAGGTRAMWYPSFEDAAGDATRLARAMTYKMAMADLPMGGGKSVISLPQSRAETSDADWQRILGLHARTLETLHGDYWTGPDVNTSSADMDVLRRTTRYAFGASTALGGSGSSAHDTARGVFVGVTAALEAVGLGRTVEGRRILVQGAGAVGHDLAELCLAAGADVLVADVDHARVAALVEAGATAVHADQAPLVACDVYAPCAVGGTITVDVAERLQCLAVAGAANNPLADDAAADVLAKRGIVYAPDYVINAGGAIHLIGKEILGWSDEEVTSHLGKIGETLDAVFDRARATSTSTETTARRLALERLSSLA
jgi:leucine dehydrogenase